MTLTKHVHIFVIKKNPLKMISTIFDLEIWIGESEFDREIMQITWVHPIIEDDGSFCETFLTCGYPNV